MNSLKILCAVFCTSFLFFTILQNASAQKVYTGQEVFGPILSELQAETNVPLRLPNYIAAEAAADPHGFMGKIFTANPNTYIVDIVTRPDCERETFCSDGMVTGEYVGSSNSLPSDGRDVTLNQNIPAKFIETFCGASCSFAKVLWIENNYLYSVQFKAAPKSYMMDIANSAISDNVAN